ncbi:dihydropteroate synthase [Algoriphagus sp. CAU 1675]|uniref:dihydropteroate synthase n=1 Tax=Algoriphagus sp. CAU 1675 TaxID=3032597 RepID=UPI0023DCB81A|nr:dihydropteroate synthase [Algoriphagus sp. CAU 1675]MDF2158456.1 dihydropteroate synthase [Algoriphagus sp. CAU 1675]
MYPASGYSSSIEDNLFPLKYTLQIKGRLIVWDKPQIMGILNTTPDSFFDKSRVSLKKDQVLAKAGKLIEEGASILDIGGYSSRPGAKEVSLEEEINRVVPAVEWITEHFPETLVSVDTFRSRVAQLAIQSGAHIVNDISSGDLDEQMINTVASLRVPYIAMHMRGKPETMQSQTQYKDILGELLNYFAQKVDLIKKSGIKDVIIDPGFGFAKSLEQNYFLLRNLNYFKTLGFPILVGISRKSMIYKLLDCNPEDALNGTTALNMVALQHGANILRVHDVKEANETLKLFSTVYS